VKLIQQYIYNAQTLTTTSTTNNKQQDLIKLLAVGGVLVGPIGDSFVKVTRLKSANGSTSSAHQHEKKSAPNSNLKLTDPASGTVLEFVQEVLAAVRFAPLQLLPRTACKLPRPLWSPAVHSTYPVHFQRRCALQLLVYATLHAYFCVTSLRSVCRNDDSFAVHVFTA
jgi:hypothetical protein